MARLRDVVVDCRHAAPLARFWAEVLDGYAVDDYTEQDVAELQARGIAGPEDDPTVCISSPAGPPRWFFCAVPEPKAVKNRMHVDLAAEDPDAELTRLVGLGATLVDDRRVTDHWVVLADPEGNEFCLMF